MLGRPAKFVAQEEITVFVEFKHVVSGDLHEWAVVLPSVIEPHLRSFRAASSSGCGSVVPGMDTEDAACLLYVLFGHGDKDGDGRFSWTLDQMGIVEVKAPSMLVGWCGRCLKHWHRFEGKVQGQVRQSVRCECVCRCCVFVYIEAQKPWYSLQAMSKRCKLRSRTCCA